MRNLVYIHFNDEADIKGWIETARRLPCYSRSSAWSRRSGIISAMSANCPSSAIANWPISASIVRTFRALPPEPTPADFRSATWRTDNARPAAGVVVSGLQFDAFPACESSSIRGSSPRALGVKNAMAGALGAKTR